MIRITIIVIMIIIKRVVTLLTITVISRILIFPRLILRGLRLSVWRPSICDVCVSPRASRVLVLMVHAVVVCFFGFSRRIILSCHSNISCSGPCNMWAFMRDVLGWGFVGDRLRDTR